MPRSVVNLPFQLRILCFLPRCNCLHNCSTKLDTSMLRFCSFPGCFLVGYCCLFRLDTVCNIHDDVRLRHSWCLPILLNNSLRAEGCVIAPMANRPSPTPDLGTIPDLWGSVSIHQMFVVNSPQHITLDWGGVVTGKQTLAI